MNIQFLSDAAGKTTAVLVPIKEWERLQKTQLRTKSTSAASTPKESKVPRRAKPTIDPLLPHNQAERNLVEAIGDMKEILAGRKEGRDADELIAELRGLQR